MGIKRDKTNSKEDFIIVEKETDNSEKNKINSKENSETEIILASDMLPEDILILPQQDKPIFPGPIFPMILPTGDTAEQIKEIYEDKEKKNILGFLYVKGEHESNTADIVIKNMSKIGSVARIMTIKSDKTGITQVFLQGIQRFEVLQIKKEEKKIIAHVAYIKEIYVEDEEVKAMTLGIMNTLREIMKNNPIFSEEIKMFLSRGTWDNAGILADFAVTLTTASGKELQEVLECIDIKKRLEKALFLLRKELDLNQLKEKITHQIEEKITKQQRDFFLREQLKVIKNELGLEKDQTAEEVGKYEKRIAKLKLSKEATEKINEEMERIKILSPQSPEYAVSKNYLDWLTALPWGTTTKDKLDVEAARKILDKDHYGLDDVKKRILEFIGVSKLRGTVEGSILCFIGPPGVGKTSLGRSIAHALGRKFFRFSLGGMRDEAEIKGHRRTYIGALPGKIIQTLKTTGTQNPVIMLDEIDKVGASYRGDPASALLEVLDPEQNSTFIDHYLDVAFDLSKVMFIATANVPDTIPEALLDRMETIRIAGYITPEKTEIAKRHLITRLLPKHGLTKKDVTFTKGAIRYLIDGYAREAGVRALEKAIKGCLRKIATMKAEGKTKDKYLVKIKNIEELLGRPKFNDDIMMKQHQSGVVMGLAWTSLGGTVLFIEAIAIPGKKGLQQTGKLGDVMIESSSIAFSFVHSNASKFKIEKDFFEHNSIHLHVPAGATPKDGPSAGVTMTTALISRATKSIVPTHLAMTGELTLTGNVLPVGGIREKMIAAKKAKVKDVILPSLNQKDFEEIPETVRSGLHPHYVSHYKEIYSLLFEEKLKKIRKKRES
ncbi:MAG: endopeptidase La [Verrucomicrobiota bacterium]|nr:endopeptidase La [Verrucomicrobiota bacterium]